MDGDSAKGRKGEELVVFNISERRRLSLYRRLYNKDGVPTREIMFFKTVKEKIMLRYTDKGTVDEAMVKEVNAQVHRGNMQTFLNKAESQYNLTEFSDELNAD